MILLPLVLQVEQIDAFDMHCQMHLLRVFWQQHISIKASVNVSKNQPHRISYNNAGLDISST